MMSVNPQRASHSTASPQVADEHLPSNASTPPATKQIHELQGRVKDLESLVGQMDRKLNSWSSSSELVNSADPVNDDDPKSPVGVVPFPKQIFGLHNTRSLMSLVRSLNACKRDLESSPWPVS